MRSAATTFATATGLFQIRLVHSFDRFTLCQWQRSGQSPPQNGRGCVGIARFPYCVGASREAAHAISSMVTTLYFFGSRSRAAASSSPGE